MQLPSWLAALLEALLPASGSPAPEPVFPPSPAPEPDPAPASPPAQGWSKSLSDCHVRIQRAYPLVEAEFISTFPGYCIQRDYSYRSPEFQFELYKKGRELQNGVWVVVLKSQVVTDKDGKTPSHHNVYPSQALDMYIKKNGVVIWPDEKKPDVCAMYMALGNLWVKRGLVSGAVWKYTWKDWDHVQVDYPII